LGEDEKILKPVQDGLAKGMVKPSLREHEFVKSIFVANVPFSVFAPTVC